MIDFQIDEADFARRRAEAAEARTHGRAGIQHIEIEILGEIDTAMAGRVRRQLDTAPYASSLHVVVDSEGGSAAAAYEMYAALLNHPAERKIAFVAGAASAAVLVIMGCDRRVAVPTSTILLHETEYPIDAAPRWTAQKHEDAAATCRWWDRQEAAIFAYRTGQSAEVFLAEMQTETEAPLSWCLANNIITEIKK